jgi:hypothetical protein
MCLTRFITFQCSKPNIKVVHLLRYSPRNHHLISQGNDSSKNWSFQKHSKKIYDKDLRGFYYSIENSKVSLPKNPKSQTYLYQSVICFQVLVPTGGKLSIEFLLSDMNQTHKRFFFSTLNRSTKITALHASFPLSVASNKWTNITFNLVDLVPKTN